MGGLRLCVWRVMGRGLGQRIEKEVNSKGEGPLGPRQGAQNRYGNKILIQIFEWLGFLLDCQPHGPTDPVLSGAPR